MPNVQLEMPLSNKKRPAKLFLLDGMALAYRSHFALIASPVRTSSGQNTSAIFGFANTLLSIIRQECPTHLAACFDTSVPTERHKLYPEYKATREAMPEELRQQIPEIIRMLQIFRIPVLRYDGYEADDVIGTISRMADEDGSFQTYMVSQDKDLGQLVSPTCCLWKPGKHGNEHTIVNLSSLLEQWNIQYASQVIDILALMGDSSDNIPGIPGIGEKTAKTLVHDFGSVENLLANVSQLKGKRRENVEVYAQQALLSKRLATINRYVPVQVKLNDLVCQEPNFEELRQFLHQHELKSLQTRIFGKEQEETVQNTAKNEPDLFDRSFLKTIRDVPHRYTLVTTAEDRRELAQKLEQAPFWCFDTETTGLDPLQDALLGIAFCMKPGEAYYVAITSPETLETFRSVFACPAEKIGHNLKFDLQVMRTAGIPGSGPFFDTMLAHSLLKPGLRHNMDDLAENILSYQTIKLKDIAPPGPKKGELLTASVPIETMAEYSSEDADITLQLAMRLKRDLVDSGMEQLFQDIEMPLLPVLADMEYEGIRILPESLREASILMESRIQQLRQQIENVAGEPINLNSPKQLGDFLFGKLHLLEKPKKTKTGQFVTDEETLSSLAHKHPVVQDILAYREASKLKSTYLDALPAFISPVDKRIHTQFHQLLTITGRLASQEPNLQNIPIRSEQGKLIRQAFVPRSEQYFILSADYSQIELRIMAALSGDSHMVQAFQQGRDIHTETAARIYGVDRNDVTSDMRRTAKTVNFGIIYGISAFGLSQRLGCSRTEAASLIKSYFTQFPGIKSYMDLLVQEATEKGYAETLCGRKRMLPDLRSANRNIRASAERASINTPIQGTAAEMIKIAMIRVQQLLAPTKSRLILQIHDELLIDLHQEEMELVASVAETMMTALPLPHDVPIVVEARTGTNWLEAH